MEIYTTGETVYVPSVHAAAVLIGTQSISTFLRNLIIFIKIPSITPYTGRGGGGRAENFSEIVRTPSGVGVCCGCVCVCVCVCVGGGCMCARVRVCVRACVCV